jgi:urease accessory protein
VCHCYIVHPPGGVVGGDDLSIDVEVDTHANALLTTPAASKFYRSEGKVARLAQRFRVHDHASLEWLPQETIYYRGARVRARTSVELSANSRFVGWEIGCLGLPARDECFDDGCLRLGFELSVEGVPRWIDCLRIDGQDRARTASWGLGGFAAIGTLLIYPGSAEILDQVRELVSPDTELASTLVDRVLVCRAASAQAEPVRHAFSACWSRLRPALLNRDAHAPRIWAT